MARVRLSGAVLSVLGAALPPGQVNEGSARFEPTPSGSGCSIVVCLLPAAARAQGHETPRQKHGGRPAGERQDERVWGPKYVKDSHYLKVFVRRLRRKLGDDPEHPRYIHTEWGMSYRFASPR